MALLQLSQKRTADALEQTPDVMPSKITATTKPFDTSAASASIDLGDRYAFGFKSSIETPDSTAVHF